MTNIVSRNVTSNTETQAALTAAKGALLIGSTRQDGQSLALGLYDAGEATTVISRPCGAREMAAALEEVAQEFARLSGITGRKKIKLVTLGDAKQIERAGEVFSGTKYSLSETGNPVKQDKALIKAIYELTLGDPEPVADALEAALADAPQEPVAIETPAETIEAEPLPATDVSDEEGEAVSLAAADQEEIAKIIEDIENADADLPITEEDRAEVTEVIDAAEAADTALPLSEEDAAGVNALLDEDEKSADLPEGAGFVALETLDLGEEERQRIRDLMVDIAQGNQEAAAPAPDAATEEAPAEEEVASEAPEAPEAPEAQAEESSKKTAIWTIAFLVLFAVIVKLIF